MGMEMGQGEGEVGNGAVKIVCSALLYRADTRDSVLVCACLSSGPVVEILGNDNKTKTL